MRWPWQKDAQMDYSSTLAEERAKTRIERSAMAEAVISLNRERSALEEMVRRSLELLEAKK